MTDRDIQKDRLKEIVKDSLMKHIDKTCSLAGYITDDLLANGVFILPEDLRGTEDFSISAFIEAMQMYKEKDRYIKLPCKVGDYVLWDNGLVGSERVMKEVKGFYYDSSGLGLRYILEDCTPTVNFCAIVGILTKEKAEAELEKRGKENAT